MFKRNLFTFTIRSTVHRNEWTNFSGMNTEQISNQLTEKIKSEFKTQMANRYAICRGNNEVDNFINYYLLDGTIGKRVGVTLCCDFYTFRSCNTCTFSFNTFAVLIATYYIIFGVVQYIIKHLFNETA